VTKVFKNMLNHRDPEVRRHTLLEMQKQMEKSSMIPMLIKSLGDENWRVRKTAVEMLINLRDETVIKELIKALYLKNTHVKNASFEILIEFGQNSTNLLINEYKHANVQVKKFIIDILGRTRDMKAFPLLLEALEDEDENIKAAAIEHLSNIRHNETVLNALIKVLKGEDVWGAYHAAIALGRIRDKKSVDALTSVISRKDIKKPVIRTLAQIADTHALSFLIPLLRDESNAIREEVVKALGEFLRNRVSGKIIIESLQFHIGEETRNTIYPYAESRNDEVRTSAFLLLGLLNDMDVIAPLLELSQREAMNKQATEVLVFLGKSMPESLIPYFETEDINQKRIVCEIAARVGSDILFKPLVACLADKDGHVRGNAALALSNLDNPQAVDYIMPLMLDEYENIQEEAITALSRLKKWINLDTVIQGLSDENPTLKRNTALLLGLLGEERAVEALEITLKDNGVRVRKAAVEALAAIGGYDAVALLIKTLTDETPEICRLAALSLGKLRNKEAVEPLIVLLGDNNPLVKATAAEALGQIGSKTAVEPLLGLLSDDSGFVQTTVIEALGNFADERVKNALVSLLKHEDAEIRSAAIESLIIFDDIVHFIIPLLKDKDWFVRKKVVDVLGRSFRKESYTFLKEVVQSDEDFQVREAAEAYLNE
jgi:HEAT repeat protein